MEPKSVLVIRKWKIVIFNGYFIYDCLGTHKTRGGVSLTKFLRAAQKCNMQYVFCLVTVITFL